MKIKIISINQVLQDINGIGKASNRPYTIKRWLCNVEVNGKVIQNIEVKTMDKTFNLELKEYEVDEKLFNNIFSYQLVKETQYKKGGGYSRPTYIQKEFDLLYAHAFEMVKPFVKDIPDMFNRLTVTSSMMATYIISATNSGVKIEQKQNESGILTDEELARIDTEFNKQTNKLTKDLMKDIDRG